MSRKLNIQRKLFGVDENNEPLLPLSSPMLIYSSYVEWGWVEWTCDRKYSKERYRTWKKYRKYQWK